MKPNNCPKCKFPATIMPHSDAILRENGWKTVVCQECGHVHSYKKIEGDVSGKTFMKEMKEKGVTHIITLFDA